MSITIPEQPIQMWTMPYSTRSSVDHLCSHKKCLFTSTCMQVAFKQAHLQQVLPHITNTGTSIQQEVGSPCSIGIVLGSAGRDPQQ